MASYNICDFSQSLGEAQVRAKVAAATASASSSISSPQTQSMFMATFTHPMTSMSIATVSETSSTTPRKSTADDGDDNDNDVDPDDKYRAFRRLSRSRYKGKCRPGAVLMGTKRWQCLCLMHLRLNLINGPYLRSLTSLI